ncbi:MULTISPECIES: hypothetical protein [Bifidobacterium]|uniref:hypothetical protein n=1 Tax=Bifidobacterium TaxID=1678 RepID=UPI0011280E2D|nr:MULTISPECIES: hypothetical protein [Bifidobacterium]KAA8828315.1 hypothetical protein EM849_11750 [Bifidobacterium tissieri]TPF96867.1 hypothetical protein EP30_05490 [Bifidobacterium sp. UTCIF-39]
MKPGRLVLNRSTVSRELLHNATILDNVETQFRGMATAHPSIEVYRNENENRGNVVATIPQAVEDKHRGMLAGMPGRLTL